MVPAVVAGQRLDDHRLPGPLRGERRASAASWTAATRSPRRLCRLFTTTGPSTARSSAARSAVRVGAKGSPAARARSAIRCRSWQNAVAATGFSTGTPRSSSLAASASACAVRALSRQTSGTPGRSGTSGCWLSTAWPRRAAGRRWRPAADGPGRR
ncbi:hypothetical protein ACFQ1I_08040 [Kitasatospora arboriphila]